MADIREFRMLIDGELVGAADGRTFESINPSTGEVACLVPDAGTEDVDRAIRAARRAFDTSDWATMGRGSRIRTVRAFVEGITERLGEFSEWETADAGHTTRLASLFTVPLAVEHSRQCIELYEQRRDVEPLPQITSPALSANYVRREPLGVCSLISPFNFPILIAMWKVAPALVTGNTAVLKPSPLAPATALLLAEVAAEHLPPGVLNVVTPSGIGPAELMTTHPLVDKVSFTGSTDTGRRIMRGAAETVKDLTLELGGKGPAVFLDDVDLDAAVPGALFGFLMHQGQACESTTRLLVPRSRYDETLERLKAAAEALVVGPADDFGSDLGPVISAGQLERTERYVKLGLDQGARLLTGGERVEIGGGFFHQPTIFADATNDMAIAQEEIFGPVLTVIPYSSEGEAISIANDTPFGLAASVWGRDVPRATSVAHRIRTGTVWINDVHLLNGYAPFGGYKQSGVGRELGPHALDAYLAVKHVHVDLSPEIGQKFWYGTLGLG
ncbi:MAG TPA: aldehyde dehydrogenase family protein [Frankiaceae bacterium]|nr:aldehyde dehydrogenase family protein [Frankiaceae bacterium]